MTKYRSVKVTLDDGRDLFVPAYTIRELRNLEADSNALEGMNWSTSAPFEKVADLLLVAIHRNHPEITRDDLLDQSAPTLLELWRAAKRASHVEAKPGEAGSP